MSALVVLFLIAGFVEAAAPDERSEVLELSCEVSAEQIAAVTANEPVMLETPDCTGLFRLFVNAQIRDARARYELFFQDIHADPQMVDRMSRLIVREQLLRGGWSSGNLNVSITHYSPELGAAEKVASQMQQVLTAQDFASFERFQQTMVARSLLEQLTARLKTAGKPLTREQLESVVSDLQPLLAIRSDRAASVQLADPIANCERSAESFNRRDDQIQNVLGRTLNEDQMAVAQSYYEDLRERRQQSVEAYREWLAKDQGAICGMPPI
jgi:hypothetical protein